MTSEERLKIAEEIVSRLRSCVELTGIKYTNHMGTCWNAWMQVTMPTSIEHVEIASHQNLIDCIHLARQKLAAEREAAMSPNERKYRGALKRVLLELEGEPTNSNLTCARMLIRDAIKEST